MKGGILAAIALILAPILLIVGGIYFAVAASSNPPAAAAAACGTASGTTGTVAKKVPDKVGQWGHDQLTVAAQLIAAAEQMQVNQQATTIVVMTAMGESSLSNPNHGDAVDNTTIGVLQQNAAYGTRDQRLDIPTAAKAFLTKLLQVDGWESMEPTLAAHAVQGNADPYHYAEFFSQAQDVVRALTGTATTSGCDVSGDQKELASVLAAAWKKGTFTDTYHPQMVEQEILPIVDGTTKPGCQVDTRILQILVAALNRYGSVQISDMNRPCVGIGTHCTSGSLHCKNPAVAVDFNAVGGKPLLGSGPQDIEFLTWLNTIMPKGSQVGQVQCRPNTPLSNFRQFSDPCSHQHVDLGSTTEQLTLSAAKGKSRS
ncbi:hypothetical protein EDF31_11234 [Curtobacterium sp. PhB142]|uniref:hypothetical protein n=1 Tax=unclassified Curtobacterium TaxID=257496 RepID=UPI001045B4DC|nr:MULTISPECIES: hypothetical protein [unclassified Curtobacterium]TCL80516.1 hypothetical protein EDF31_11234 [Curtobacterium sp. PhB142]TCL99756.1 hypothetical protein EDF26_11334 [Curtobacterium sp. PhB134]